MSLFASVKQHISIKEMLDDLGVNIKFNKIRSPFNLERHSSCHIYSKTNSFYDYSSNRSGTIIDLFMGIKGLSTPYEAVMELAALYGIQDDRDFTPRPPRPIPYSEIEDKAIISIIGAFEFLSKDTPAEYVQLSVEGILQLISYFELQTVRETLLGKLQGRRSDQFAILD